MKKRIMTVAAIAVFIFALTACGTPTGSNNPVNPTTEPTTEAQTPTDVPEVVEPTTEPTVEPTATSTPVPTATSTPVPTSTPTPEPTPTNTPVPTATPTPEPTPTPVVEKTPYDELFELDTYEERFKYANNTDWSKYGYELCEVIVDYDVPGCDFVTFDWFQTVKGEDDHRPNSLPAGYAYTELTLYGIKELSTNEVTYYLVRGVFYGFYDIGDYECEEFILKDYYTAEQVEAKYGVDLEAIDWSKPADAY